MHVHMECEMKSAARSAFMDEFAHAHLVSRPAPPSSPLPPSLPLQECSIYMSFYFETANREAFMAAKQDMLLAFVDVVERNGAQLATPRTLVEMDKDLAEVG